VFVADSLSRPCSSTAPADQVRKCCLIETHVSLSVDALLGPVDCQTVDLRCATESDADSQGCVKYIRNGWPSDRTLLSEELLKHHNDADRLTYGRGIIFYDGRTYIPRQLCPTYLAKCHEGHQGIGKTRARARQCIYWPGLSIDIANHVEGCNTCIKFSSVRQEPAVEFPLPDGPWEELACDLFEFQGKHYLVIIDYYSRWIDAIPLPIRPPRR